VRARGVERDTQVTGRLLQAAAIGKAKRQLRLLVGELEELADGLHRWRALGVLLDADEHGHRRGYVELVRLH
jgi:hypothetical protein